MADHAAAQARREASVKTLDRAATELEDRPLLQGALREVAAGLKADCGDRSPDAQLLEEQVTRIAAYALWTLRDISQYEEPKRFRRTRLELKARLDFWDREAKTKADGIAILTIPGELVERFGAVVLAAVDDAKKKTEGATAREVVKWAARIEGLLTVADQLPGDPAEQEEVGVYGSAELLSDVIFSSVASHEADSDPWPTWVDSVIPTLREAMSQGGKS